MPWPARSKPIGEVFVVAPAHEMSAASHSLTLISPASHRQDRRASLLGRRDSDRLHYAGDERNTARTVLPTSSSQASTREATSATMWPTPARSRARLKHRSMGFRASRSAWYSALTSTSPSGRARSRAREPRARRRTAARHPAQCQRSSRTGSRHARHPSGHEDHQAHDHRGPDPRQRKYYWIGEEALTWNEEEGTDYEAVRHGLGLHHTACETILPTIALSTRSRRGTGSQFWKHRRNEIERFESRHDRRTSVPTSGPDGRAVAEPRHPRRARAGGDAGDPAPSIRARSASAKGVRRPRPANRRHADDLAAVHGRADDRTARSG